MIISDNFLKYIDSVKSEKRYRIFNVIDRATEHGTYGINQDTGEKVAIWCTTDYFNMGKDPEVIQYAHAMLNMYGTSVNGSRNIGGNNTCVIRLEKTIAHLHNKESALVFTSGYAANLGTIITLAKILPNIIFFSDQLNHSSIINGIRRSASKKEIFAHNDWMALDSLLAKYDNSFSKVVVCESVYSMTGGVAPLKEICAIAKKHNALVYVDEVHAVGVYGSKGGGISQAMNLEEQIDIIQGTLSKTFGTIGGYISGKHEVVDAIRCACDDFIFTTAIPPFICAVADLIIQKVINDASDLRGKMQSNITLLKNIMQQYDLTTTSNTQIMPIMIYDPELASKISSCMLNDYKIYIRHANFPTVPRGQERLRVTVTPGHTEEMMHYLCDSLKKAMSRFTH